MLLRAVNDRDAERGTTFLVLGGFRVTSDEWFTKVPVCGNTFRVLPVADLALTRLLPLLTLPRSLAPRGVFERLLMNGPDCGYTLLLDLSLGRVPIRGAIGLPARSPPLDFFRGL